MARLKHFAEMTLRELQDEISRLNESIMEARCEAPSLVKGYREDLSEVKALIAARKKGIKPVKAQRKTNERPFAEADSRWLRNELVYAVHHASQTYIENIRAELMLRG